MKVIKPQLLGFLSRTYKRDGNRLALTGMVPFPLVSPDNPITEQEMWRTIRPELPENGVWDEGIPKDRGEVLFQARAYAPGGVPVLHRRVSVRVGGVAKSLDVHGDRVWERHVGGWRPSEAQPFVEMPIDFSRDFGGTGYSPNPTGKGSGQMSASDPLPLPNIESPFAPMTSPEETPELSALGALHPTWSLRYSKIGSYQPGEIGGQPPSFPANADWTLYNQSLPDQWIPGFWSGGEPFLLEGLNPVSDRQEGRLPKIRIRSFVTRSDKDGESFVEVPMHPETLWFFPHLGLGVVIHRGSMTIETDDAAEISSVLVAAEDPGDNRPESHYLAYQKRRESRDPKDLSRYGDAPLLPVRLESDPKANTADVRYHLANLPSNSSERSKRILLEKIDQIQKQGEKSSEAMKNSSPILPMGDKGPDTGKIGTPFAIQNQKLSEIRQAVLNLPVKSPLETLEEALSNKPDREALTTQIEGRIREAASRIPDDILQKKNLRREDLLATPLLQAPFRKEMLQMCSPGGLKEKLRKNGEGLSPGNPAGTLHESELPAEGVSARIDTALSVIDRLQEKMESLAIMSNNFVRSVHLFPPPPPDPERAAENRRKIIGELGSGARNFRERELRGSDLSRLDLSGCDFSEADLIGCDFSGALLTGARFSGAWAAHARFSGCTLTRADFSGANCGGADFSGTLGTQAVFVRSILSGTVLDQCDLTECRFDGADFTNVVFNRSKIRKGILSNARFIRIKGLSPSKGTLSGASSDSDRLHFIEADFSGSHFEKALFMKVDFTRCVFESCVLSKATFLDCSGPETRFDRAVLHKTSFPQSTDFSRASFRGADLTGANLRGMVLQESDFCGSVLSGADGSGGNWRHAKLSGVKAIQARFHKTDLKYVDGRGTDFRQTLFLKADLLFADFRYASLYKAGLTGARFDDSTRWDHALGRSVPGGHEGT
ncbi:MAG: DUF2169 domain-containing protein [Nitrospirota bacterium]|nr:DUF2169 domain-containing protein [Nitrospirota bacterium]